MLVECSSNHLSSALEISTGGLKLGNIHFLGYTRHGVTSQYNRKDVLPSLNHSTKTLLSINANFDVQYAAISCACVHMNSEVHISGFLAHPAIVDSCFHIGAIVASYNFKTSPRSAYIPVAFSAFTVFAPLQPISKVYAHAEINAGKDVLLSSYRMRQYGDTTPSGFQLIDLHARASQFEQSLDAHLTRHSMPMSYTIQWQCGVRVAPHIGKERVLPFGTGHIWLNDHGRFFGTTTYTYKSVASSFLKDIALIQSLDLLRLSRQTINMLSAASPLHDSVIPSGRPSEPSHHLYNKLNSCASSYRNAAALGAIKVASFEHPEHVWGAIIANSLTYDSPMIPKDTDAFGQVISGRGIFLPLVLVASQQLARTSMFCKAAVGKAIISGGLNGVFLDCVAHRNIRSARYALHNIPIRNVLQYIWLYQLAI